MLDQTDFNKIEKGSAKAKKVDGMVYSTKKGVSNFHQLQELPVNGVALGELISKIFESQDNFNEKLDDKLETLKHILLAQEERIASLEMKIAKYGLE